MADPHRRDLSPQTRIEQWNADMILQMALGCAQQTSSSTKFVFVLTFIDSWPIQIQVIMNALEWIEVRLVELLASLFAVGLLIAGLAAGVPFLRARIAEVLLYSVCCVSAVVLHAGIDLGVRGARRIGRALTPAPAMPALEPAVA